MQLAMRVHPELFPYPLEAPVPRTQTPMLTYAALLQSMGAMPGVSLQPMRRRPGGPDLFSVKRPTVLVFLPSSTNSPMQLCTGPARYFQRFVSDCTGFSTGPSRGCKGLD